MRNWKYKATDIDVNGSWAISVFYRPQYYENSFSWNGYASYLKQSINPATGPSPYQSYFHVSPNEENKSIPWYIADQSDYPPVFTSYNWSATRNGGCCGLTVRLTK